jgi:hypothetical protein
VLSRSIKKYKFIEYCGGLTSFSAVSRFESQPGDRCPYSRPAGPCSRMGPSSRGRPVHYPNTLKFVLVFTKIIFPHWIVFPMCYVFTARNGPVYAGMPYWHFFLFLNFIPAVINIYYVHLPFYVFLTVYPCFAFKKYTDTSKFPFRAPCVSHYIGFNLGMIFCTWDRLLCRYLKTPLFILPCIYLCMFTLFK